MHRISLSKAWFSGTMATHKRKKIVSFVLLAFIHMNHLSDAYSHIQKMTIPDQPIGEVAEENHKSLNLETNGRNRRIKSGKDYKASKKSKTSKERNQSYYEDSYYTSSYAFQKRPAPSPTHGFTPVRESVHHNYNPTTKPISYYDLVELSEYNSYSDMIDYYYIKHGGDTYSDDKPLKPSPISPTLPPIRRPEMDSSIWSDSEDEITRSPTAIPTRSPSRKPTTSPSMVPTRSPIMLPTGLSSPKPSISPLPSVGQCMVRIMLDQCSSLLQSIEQEEGCDCYNFCGGVYLGCCAIEDPCPLTCEVLGGFVAGCRFGSEAPSMSPTTKTKITEEPTLLITLTPTSASMENPTKIPEFNTLSPTKFVTPPSIDTTMPTMDIVSISLQLFTLEYEVDFSRSIAQSDLVVLTSITNSYLQVYMSSAFQSDSIIMVDFVTEYEAFLEDPESSVVLVTFKSTSFFDPSSQDLPSRIDLERELLFAFQGVASAGYLGRVQGLPTSNAFSTTSQIFMVQNPPIVSTLESKQFSSVAAATAIFAIAIVTSLAGFSWYRTRRKRRRVEASDKFLRNGTGLHAEEGHTMRQSDVEDERLNRSEERLSTKLLEEIERIEGIRRNLEDRLEGLQLMNRDNVSRDSDFDSEGNNIFEDDTIEDDEDYSMHEIGTETLVDDQANHFFKRAN